MQKLKIDVPDDLAGELEPYRGRLVELLIRGLHQTKLEEALGLYIGAEMSFARAVELAGVSRHDLESLALARGIRPRWSEETARQELA
jgi:predicted HTH domain antitoxin